MVIANSVKTSTPNYVISDISLSDFGRKEIKIAETEMPGLMALRNKYQSEVAIHNIICLIYYFIFVACHHHCLAQKLHILTPNCETMEHT